MRACAVIIAAALLGVVCARGEPPPPRVPYHLLLGPYQYELSRKELARVLALRDKRFKNFAELRAAIDALPHGKRVPRYYSLDDKHYTTIPALEAAIAALPRGSTVYLRGGCEPHSSIELPPQPISLSALEAYCRRQGITFTWTFGPGGY
jgi:hypothetical protein